MMTLCTDLERKIGRSDHGAPPARFFSSPSNVLCLAWRKFGYGVSSLELKNMTPFMGIPKYDF